MDPSRSLALRAAAAQRREVAMQGQRDVVDVDRAGQHREQVGLVRIVVAAGGQAAQHDIARDLLRVDHRRLRIGKMAVALIQWNSRHEAVGAPSQVRGGRHQRFADRAFGDLPREQRAYRRGESGIPEPAAHHPAQERPWRAPGIVLRQHEIHPDQRAQANQRTRRPIGHAQSSAERDGQQHQPRGQRMAHHQRDRRRRAGQHQRGGQHAPGFAGKGFRDVDQRHAEGAQRQADGQVQCRRAGPAHRPPEGRPQAAFARR